LISQLDSKIAFV